MSDAVERRRFKVTGRVQGVGFRAHTQREAQRLGLVGFVRNRTDGAVDGEVEGAPQPVEQFCQWLAHGPAWARVERLSVEPVAPGGGAGFEVRPTGS